MITPIKHSNNNIIFQGTKEDKKSFYKPLTIVATGGIGAIAGDVLTFKKDLPIDKALLEEEQKINTKLKKVSSNIHNLYSNQKSIEALPFMENLYKTLFAPMYNENFKLIPNCICIEGKDEGCKNSLIKYMQDYVVSTKGKEHRFITTDAKADFTELLQQNKKHFEKTKKFTVLYVKDMDTLINPKTATDNTIGAMKGIMDKSSKFFYTTLLFTTQNPNELDKIAMGPHRVHQISVDKYGKEIEEYETETKNFKEKLKQLKSEKSTLEKELKNVKDKQAEFTLKKVKQLRLKNSLIGAGLGILAAFVGILALGKKK